MIDRKEKEAEFFAHHQKLFSKLGLHDPMFTLKTAFYQKGKQGRHSQFFEWELNKSCDIYIEFYDYIDTENGKDMIPMLPERRLFLLKSNPFFKEEYDTKEIIKNTGESYNAYLVPLAEMLVVLNDGTMISYHDFENGNYKEPQEQMSLSHFPDFEQELNLSKKSIKSDFDIDKTNLPISEMDIKDFAAIIWQKPVSDKKWLNDLITKTYY